MGMKKRTSMEEIDTKSLRLHRNDLIKYIVAESIMRNVPIEEIVAYLDRSLKKIDEDHLNAMKRLLKEIDRLTKELNSIDKSLQWGDQ